MTSMELESLRCSDGANLRDRHFRADPRAAAESSVLTKAAHRLWPGNPEIVRLYTSVLVEEGRLEDAASYLVECAGRESTEVVYPVMAAYTGYLASRLPPERARERLLALQEEIIDPASRGAILAQLLLLQHALGEHDQECSTFLELTELQSLNPGLIASCGSALLKNHSPLPPADGVPVLLAMAQATLLPIFLAHLATSAVVCDRGVSQMLLELLSSRELLSAPELSRLKQAITAQQRRFHDPVRIAEIRRAIRSVDWSFLETFRDPPQIELELVPTRSEFGPGESPVLEIRVWNRSAAPIPLGRPGPFSNRVYVYGWTRNVRGPGASQMIHADLTNLTVDCPNGVPPHTFVSRRARMGTDPAGLAYDLLVTSDLEATLFCVAGIEERILEFDPVFMEYAGEALLGGTAISPGSLPDMNLGSLSADIRFSPIVVFRTRGVEMTEEGMSDLVQRIIGDEGDLAAVDLAGNLYASEGGNLEGREERALKVRWGPEVHRALLQQMDSGDFCRRAAAARALVFLQNYGENESDREAILDLLRDESWYVRLNALITIRKAEEGIGSDVAEALEEEKDRLVLAMMAAFRESE